MFSDSFSWEHPATTDAVSGAVVRLLLALPSVRAVANAQFYLGPPGTGSPLHWHNAALNFLAFGEKRWLLAPPSHPAAAYSNAPVLQWLHQMRQEDDEEEEQQQQRRRQQQQQQQQQQQHNQQQQGVGENEARGGGSSSSSSSRAEHDDGKNDSGRSETTTTSSSSSSTTTGVERRGLLQCTQFAGDLVFVPKQWAHATLNLRASIGAYRCSAVVAAAAAATSSLLRL